MAKADVDIWMPLYVADYLADTNRLTTIQHGAYLLLLVDYWRGGEIPNDKATLLQITRLSDDAWSMLEALLKHYFKLSTSNTWVHARVERELESARGKRLKASEKASKAANSRWNNASSIPQAMPEQCPSPSPSPIVISANADMPAPAIKERGVTVPHLAIIALYNDMLGSQGLTLVKPALWKGSRETNLRARWREADNRQSLDWWRGWFEYIAKSDFLMGKAKSDRPFRADLEWLVTFKNFAKVCEGKYHG